MYNLNPDQERKVLNTFIDRLSNGKVPKVLSAKHTLQGKYYGSTEAEELNYVLKRTEKDRESELNVFSSRLGSLSILRNDTNTDEFDIIERWMVKIEVDGHSLVKTELLSIACN